MESEYQSAVEQYMNGYCMFMAAALHHKYNVPIGLLLIKHDKWHLCHAWVCLPNGKYFDVQGQQNLKQVTSFREDTEMEYKVICPATLAELESISKADLSVGESDVVRALEITERFWTRMGMDVFNTCRQ